MTPAPEKAAPIPALLLCPFCGADGDRLVCSVEGEDDYFNVGCEDCDCRTAWFDDRAGAIAAWNRRADRASQEERIREDERDRLYAEAEMQHAAALLRQDAIAGDLHAGAALWLKECGKGAMPPRRPRPPAGRRVMSYGLIERLRAHPGKAVVRHWEDWAQEADTLMREAAAALEAEASEGERRGLERAAEVADQHYRNRQRSWKESRVDLEGSRSLEAKDIAEAIRALIPEAPAREGE